MSVITIFKDASLFNQLILLVLILLSILSWAVVIERWRYFARARKQDDQFFNSIDQWDAGVLHDCARRHPRSPSGKIYLAAERETERLGRDDADTWAESLQIERDLVRGEGERGLPLLAIVASASPFIGLLGTVWGVMIAFLRLGRLQGQPALEVVGPGIAEALIATAAGLFAAIPAVIAYNAFLARQRGLLRRADDFNRRLVVTIGGEGFGR
ncbi:hypothetical protein GF324_05665 [bacterium]|nr:hypothetical protein [bacterium]